MLLVVFTISLSAQPIRVNLNENITLDDEEINITPFYDNPKEKLILPERDKTKAKFFDIYYSNSDDDDNKISLMVIKTDTSDLLYIDKNNDEDLTNDNSPYIFNLKDNDFIFDIIKEKDARQTLKISLQRKPDFNHENVVESEIITSNGDLKKNITNIYKSLHPNFTGKKGTFYFYNRITLSRGKLILSNKTYQVGLYDFNNNGLFNDTEGKASDLFIIDLNEDKKLGLEIVQEVFKLNDVFEINGHNYKITTIDPYGRFLEIKETSEETTFYYLKKIQESASKNVNLLNNIVLNDKFWNLTLKTLDGKPFHINTKKEKYLLLNFWGLWCKPCIAEIPELVYVSRIIPKEKFEMISILVMSDLELAKKMINEKEMHWTHVLDNEEMKKMFKVIGYPTNILISPKGKILFNCYLINRTIFSEYIK